jgi:biopolymer transport protein ExbD
MSKFGKKKKGMPALNTSALPDIVFMLLFFFMVTTTMRETDLLIGSPILPNSSETKKLEHKSLVSTIYVGKAKDEVKYGTGDQIQLNDKLAQVAEVASFIYMERSTRKEEEIPAMTTSIKADVSANYGTIQDIRSELRDVRALKVSYSSRGGDVRNNVKKN